MSYAPRTPRSGRSSCVVVAELLEGRTLLAQIVVAAEPTISMTNSPPAAPATVTSYDGLDWRRTARITPAADAPVGSHPGEFTWSGDLVIEVKPTGTDVRGTPVTVELDTYGTIGWKRNPSIFDPNTRQGTSTGELTANVRGGGQLFRAVGGVREPEDWDSHVTSTDSSSNRGTASVATTIGGSFVITMVGSGRSDAWMGSLGPQGELWAEVIVLGKIAAVGGPPPPTPPKSPDSSVSALKWDPKKGGASFRYAVGKGKLPSPAMIGVYWSADKTYSPDDALVKSWAVKKSGAGTRAIAGNDLRFAPDSAAYLLAVADPADALAEPAKNNLSALADVKIGGSAISDYAKSVLKGALRVVGQAKGATVSSTYRSTEDQARVMYDVLVGPVTKEMRKKEFSTTVAYSYALYGAKGKGAIDAYVDGRAGGLAADEIQALMQAEIELAKEADPDAFPHTRDPAKWHVFDVGAKSIDYDKRFHDALTGDVRIHRVLSPFTKPYDKAFHVELPVGVVVA